MARLKVGRSAKVSPSHATPVKSNYVFADGVHNVLRSRWEHAIKRLRRQIIKATSYKLPSDLNVTDNATEAMRYLQLAVDNLEKVPDTWKPARGAIGGSVIEEESVIRIRPEHLSKYDGLFENGDQTLCVKKVVGSKLQCMINGSNTMIIVPRSHIYTGGT